MNRKKKLELTWIGRENRPKLEPRILWEDPEQSSHAKHGVIDHELFDNRLIIDRSLHLTKLRQNECFPFAKCCPKICWPKG